MGRGAISGWKDAPEVKPSRRLEETVPEELRRHRKSENGEHGLEQESERRWRDMARDLVKRRN